MHIRRFYKLCSDFTLQHPIGAFLFAVTASLAAAWIWAQIRPEAEAQTITLSWYFTSEEDLVAQLRISSTDNSPPPPEEIKELISSSIRGDSPESQPTRNDIAYSLTNTIPLRLKKHGLLLTDLKLGNTLSNLQSTTWNEHLEERLLISPLDSGITSDANNSTTDSATEAPPAEKYQNESYTGVQTTQETINISNSPFNEIRSTTPYHVGVDYLLKLFEEELKSMDPNSFRFDVYNDIAADATIVVPTGAQVSDMYNKLVVQYENVIMYIFVNHDNRSSVEQMVHRPPPSLINIPPGLNWHIDTRYSPAHLRQFDYADGTSWGRVVWQGVDDSTHLTCVSIASKRANSTLQIMAVKDKSISTEKWFIMDLSAHLSGFSSE